jgi:deoxyribodipyrimidine photo-lyase
MPLYNRSLVWLRRDLRLSDHTALAEAEHLSDSVAVAFVFDRNILGALADNSDRRVNFIHHSLRELNGTLAQHGSALLVRTGDPAHELPLLARELRADAVFANRDYEPYAMQRDASVGEALRAIGVAFHSCKDQVIYEKQEILSGKGTPFRVFTPYKNAWLHRFHSAVFLGEHPAAERPVHLRSLLPAKEITALIQPWDLRDLGFEQTALWLQPGERAAKQRLKQFTVRLPGYAETRDFPALESTSGLSAHLRFGTISIRELVRAALDHPSPGADIWLSELIWREFYQMILDQYPHVVNHAFKPECDSIVWPGSDEHFEAWSEGRTGYPLVDAAMRHFNNTGWMHNRLRMVVAMFLTKDLLVDWRRGERYFADRLLDFDLAANNGGWQWSASTGCDAQPYFRVFNPVLQSRKFDPEGVFIREHCPELRGFSNTHVHFPAAAPLAVQQRAGCVIGRDYPAPIVDHAAQKEKAIALFKNLTPGPSP